MKKWLKFFFLSFFSHKYSKDGAKRGYTNIFLGLLIAFVFLWVGFVGADMLPFGTRYNNASDFSNTVHTLLANADVGQRVVLEIKDGTLLARGNDGEYTEGLLVNTFESDTDREIYSLYGYNVVVDTRSADTPAEIEAYCISNDGQNLEISYEEYLTLSAVAKMNFDFRLRYTGRDLELTDDKVEGYLSYLSSLGDEVKSSVESMSDELSDGKITKSEYNRKVYEAYFTNYYPEITEYESTSKIPLLRNYYYHLYIKDGAEKYLMIFDDYLAASYETDRGIKHSFYGFFSDIEDGLVVMEGADVAEAEAASDDFIKSSFGSVLLLTLYAYAMNIFTFIPFIALMPLVVTLLAYSVLKLCGVESVTSFGALFKILGSYVWFSGAASALLTVIIAFFAPPDIITLIPLVLFFVTMVVRSMVFAITEAREYRKQTEEQTVHTEI